MLYLIIIFLIILLGIFISFKHRLNLYQINKSVAWRDLLNIPKRFFYDVHDVVKREQQSANMHMLLAGGTVISIALLVPAVLFKKISFIGIIGTLVILAGVLVLTKRRDGKFKSLRSAGSFLKLPLMFGLFATSLLLLFLAVFFDINAFFHFLIFVIAVITSSFIAFGGFLYNPLKHIFSGSLNLAFHPRPARFSQNDTAIQPIATNDSERLGVRSIQDFSWQQRLNIDACIECGRCQDICPAFAAGQPLNPKKFIQDLYHSLLAVNNTSKNETYSGVDHPNLNWQSDNSENIVGGFIAADTLWSCTTCRACVYECPMMLEHVDAVIDLRRYQNMALGALPENSAKILTSLRDTGTLSNHNLNTRANWATEFNLDFMQEGINYDVLLWIGEAGFELHNQKTLRQLVAIIKQQGLSIGILEEERDCGDVARRLGDEALFHQLEDKNTNELKRYSFTTLLTCDPHVYHLFSREYNNLDIKVEHHIEFLARILKDQTLDKLDMKNVTYHDPCYLGRYNDIIDAPRNLLKKMGIKIDEMQRSAYRSRCCGYGGGAVFSDIKGETRIADMRMDDAKQIGAKTMLVACPNCKTMLDAVVDQDIEVMDIVQLISKGQNATN